ncbi:FAD-dependent oxidoreductase [Herpetosiphon llansteffanensis]
MQQSKFWLLHEITTIASRYCTNAPAIQQHTAGYPILPENRILTAIVEFVLEGATMVHDHALVIGASISGLATAHILSHYFAQVTIIERDRLPESIEVRAGLPQARHLHLLLMRGAHELERLFPGIGQALVAQGAQDIDLMHDYRYLMAGGWAKPHQSTHRTISASRPLYDWVLLQRLRQNPKIRIESQTDVLGLVGDLRHVRGINTKRRDTGVEQQFLAEMIVDCSGRSSKLDQWLQALGSPQVPETSVASNIGYCSRIYAKPAGWNEWKGLFVRQQPLVNPRGAILTEIEGERWIVTCGGFNQAKPPLEEGEWLNWLKQLRSPIMYELLSQAQALSPLVGFGRTENRQRHYEQIAMPAGIVALGDAVCAFNPIYGQGISNATIGALLLDQQLKQQDRGAAAWGQRFQQALAKSNLFPWSLAVGEDARYNPSVKRSFGATLRRHYFDQINLATSSNPVVLNRFTPVVHMTASPTELLRPSMLWQVIKGRLQRQPAAANTPPIPHQLNVNTINNA